MTMTTGVALTTVTPTSSRIIILCQEPKEEKMAKPVRSDHVDTYGPWAWVAGMAFAGFITWLMFYIADGFS
jgi:hypothetical protein